MTDAWMEAIAACPDLVSFNNLGVNPGRLSSEGMALLARCTKLESLGLCTQQTLSDRDFAAIINLCDSGDPRVGDESIAEIAKLANLSTFIFRGLAPDAQAGRLLDALGGKPLYSLMLHGVDLDDEALASLGAFPALIHFVIPGATGVTDAGVRIIAEKCPNIANFHLGSAAGLTDKTLELLAGMRNLRTLSVNGRDMTVEGIEAFRRRRPNVSLHFTATDDQ
jgi:hypothetical protein